jgi:hypothetical protein
MKGKKMSELMTGIKTPAVIPKTYGWYEFRQNNSGGSFQMDDEVTVHVLIQAASAREADIKAEDIGIYFDGVRDGCDCDCCGDRWHRADDAMESFTTYAYRNNWTPTTHANVRDYAQAVADEDMWAKAGTPYVILYFADGTVERFFNTKKGN